MSSEKQKQNDEVDLFDVFEIIWAGKLLIVATTIAALFFGFGYTKIATPKYKVRSGYNVSYYPNSVKRACLGHKSCAQDLMARKAIKFLAENNTWQNDSNDSELFAFTENPLKVGEYATNIENAKKKLDSYFYTEANLEINSFASNLPEVMKATEIAAAAHIEALLVVNLIEGGAGLMTFDNVVIEKRSPRTKYILSLSSLVGVMLGLLMVFAQLKFGARKKKLES